MKLDKAIELSPDIVKSLRQNKFTDYADAAQMGLEALKRIRSYRARSILDELDLIPGEDPE